jgi:hypothetical protein
MSPQAELSELGRVARQMDDSARRQAVLAEPDRLAVARQRRARILVALRALRDDDPGSGA